MLAVDAAANRDDARLLLVEQHLGVELLGSGPVAVDDPQKAVRVDLVLELAQEPVDREHQAIGPFGANVTRD